LTLDYGGSADIDLLMADLGVSITYRSRIEEVSFDPTTGKAVPTYRDATVVTIRGQYDLAAVARATGQIQMGDVFFRIKEADLVDDSGGVDIVPKATDQIVYGGTAYEVYAAELSSDELIWKISARKV